MQKQIFSIATIAVLATLVGCKSDTGIISYKAPVFRPIEIEFKKLDFCSDSANLTVIQGALQNEARLEVLAKNASYHYLGSRSGMWKPESESAKRTMVQIGCSEEYVKKYPEGFVLVTPEDPAKIHAERVLICGQPNFKGLTIDTDVLILDNATINSDGLFSIKTGKIVVDGQSSLTSFDKAEDLLARSKAERRSNRLLVWAGMEGLGKLTIDSKRTSCAEEEKNKQKKEAEEKAKEEARRADERSRTEKRERGTTRALRKHSQW